MTAVSHAIDSDDFSIETDLIEMSVAANPSLSPGHISGPSHLLRRGGRWVPRVVSVVVAALLVGGGFLLVPRLHTVRLALGHVRHTQPGWLAACIVAALATCVASAFGLRAAIGRNLRLRDMVEVELAASAANRIAPIGLGGVGVKSLYLCRTGAAPAEAAAALALVGILGALVHVTCLTITVLITGGEAHVPTPLLFALGLAIVVGGIVAARSRPGGRVRVGLDHVVVTIRAALHDRSRLRALVLSALSVTGLNVLALGFACRAVGAGMPWLTVASIYLTGRAVAAAAPTPNGLGAAEAALIAGLTSAGMIGSVALAAVLVYRLVTFWLPILPGVISARRLRHTHARTTLSPA